MRYIGLIFIILWTAHVASAQVWDDFSDGELRNNPAWVGDLDSFRVNDNFQLQLNAQGAGSCCIATIIPALTGDVEWQFFIRENFAPSGNNYTRFYLMSDGGSLQSPLNGYYLQFGEAGARDAVRLYRQTGTTSDLLCSLPDSLVASSFSIQVKVVRTIGGDWMLYCSSNNSEALTYFAQCTDATHSTMNYLGITCQYTALNRDKFFFDDIYCGAPIFDTIPPALMQVVLDPSDEAVLLLGFSEPLDSAAVSPLHYIIDSIGNPLAVEFTTADCRELRLRFANALPKNTLMNLNISGIKDIAGNAAADTTVELLFAQASLFDVVITEIMSKPTPTVGLPEAEYVEIKNRCNYPLTLGGWTLKTGNYRRTIHALTLNPHEYAVICAVADTASFAPYGKTTYTSAMQITDAGQEITLLDEYSNAIHWVCFSADWHGSDKKGGGWSLEMIDTDNPCQGSDNWTSSKAAAGGTPGMQNSVNRSNSDEVAPQISAIASENDQVIVVYFSEPILPKYINNKNAFRIDRHISVDTILFVAGDMQSLRLQLSKSIEKGVVYNLSIADTLMDCARNLMSVGSSFAFGYAQNASRDDVIINEVLFNPKNDGVDFVEIYNRSNKIIDLGTLRLSTLKNDGSLDTVGKVISLTGRQFFPQQYLVLTTRPEVVCSQYHCLYPENLLAMTALPSYPNTSGTVILLSQTEVIDRFDYNDKMHYPLYKEVKGVSLERIHFDSPTNDANNWHSTASTAGYATPGYRNSSYSDEVTHQTMFVCQPEIFSPDADGFDDVMMLSYSFPKAGNRLTVHVYNVNGVKLRTLLNNELVETEGYLTWDGVIDGNIKAPIGTYILLIQYWNTDGKTLSVKKTCVVASKK